MIRPSQRHFATENLDPRLRAGLGGHWIGGGSGLTWLDRSGNGNHGALTNGPLWTLGVGGKRAALQFDGVDDWVNVGGPASLYGLLTDLTVASWVKTVDASWCAFSNGAGDNGGWGIASFGIGLANVLNTYVGGAWRNGQTPINDGHWHHVGYTLSSQAGGSLQFYVDGRPDGALVTGTGAHNGGGGAGVRFGQASGGFAGAVDDARIYSRALSGSEMALLGQPTFLPVVPRRWFIGPGASVITTTDATAASATWVAPAATARLRLTTQATAAVSTWTAPAATARTRYTVPATAAYSSWAAPSASAQLARRRSIPITGSRSSYSIAGSRASYHIEVS